MLYTIIVKEQPCYDLADEYITEHVFTDTDYANLIERICVYRDEAYREGGLTWFEDPYNYGPYLYESVEAHTMSYDDIPF